MTMFKQLTVWAGLVATLFIGAPVQAFQERQSFDVSVTIPIHEAYVLPSEPDWMAQDQLLAWDLATSRLGRLRKNFDVKNLNGGVAARLGDVPYLLSGNDRIDLRVLFNRVPLTLDSTQVLSADEAGMGRRVELDISAIEPQGGYQGGAYYGTVHLMFDFLAP